MMSGLKTFSSKFPIEPAIPIAASLPITWTQTIVIASHCVGFTFPGMIEEPGSFAGRIELAESRCAVRNRASGCRWRS